MKAKTPEEMAELPAVLEAFGVCSLSLIQRACEKINNSPANKKEKTNYLFANELVKMAVCHIKFMVIQIMAKRRTLVNDLKLQ